MGETIPAGPYAEVLEMGFNNPSQNVCFSIRSISADAIRNGQYIKKLHQIYTFDYVLEGGLSFADKYSCPAMEGFKEQGVITEIESISMSRDRFVRAYKNLAMVKKSVSLEHSKEVGAEVMKSLGWQLNDEDATPVFVRW